MLKVSKIVMVAGAVLLANLQPLQAAGIGGLGIQYDQMPVGTAAFYKKYDDDSWTDVYVGKKGGKYIVKRYDGNKTSGRKIATFTFDANGRMVQERGSAKSSSHSYRYKYRPYKCVYQLGNCTQKAVFVGEGYVNSGQGATWGIETRKEKGGYRTFYHKPKTGESGGSFSFKLGKFNLHAIEQWRSEGENRWIKLISLK